MGTLKFFEAFKQKIKYMKFLLVLMGLVSSQSTYENCTTIEQCNYTCDNRENCFGTGRRNKQDTACCGENDLDEICNAENLEAVCMGLPTNLTMINGGFSFDCCDIFSATTTSTPTTVNTTVAETTPSPTTLATTAATTTTSNAAITVLSVYSLLILFFA